MKKLYSHGLAILALLFCNVLLAQNNQRLKDIAQNYSLDRNNNIHYLQVKNVVYENNAESFLNSTVLSDGMKVKKAKVEVDELGFTHTRYDVMFNNVRVNNTQIIVHSQSGKVISVNGDAFALKAPANTAAISKNKAFQNALQKVNAKKYKWENKAEEAQMREALGKPEFTYFPKGELILHTKGDKIYYAYKFTIYAEEPLYRANVIVDAGNGTILEEENLICTADVPSTANTKYSGVKSFTTDMVSAGNYRLRETGRGGGIRTYDMNNGTSYAAAVDFTNTTTSWTTTGIDQAATDAHWGAEMTWDYYMLNHGRNSVDGAGYNLLSYVHYSTSYNNAFWDGTRMTYGDGSGSYTIFTGLDVCGHEITHGVTSNSSNLTYSYESGALNESYSDIFGNSIENYARPTQWSWKIGEDITVSGNGLRNMSNPNLFGDPDTYLGTYWYTGTGDNGGVHTNSGVSNFWYYLLVQGGSGTNDISNSYSVSAIGWTAASRIAFRANTFYYTPSTNYSTARNLSIQAAIDLYGICSNEVKQVTNAWYAVGVGPAYTSTVSSNFNASSTSFCGVPATINFNNTTAGGMSYQWNFGDGSAVSTATNPAHTYTANGTYSVKLKATGCLSSVDSITKVAYITISTPANPTTTGASRCGTGTLSLGASGSSQLYWYTSPTGTGTPVNIGTSYTTPSLTNTTTYYVVNTASNTPVFGAPTSSAVGSGSNYNTATAYDIFNVTQPCTLKTVVAYASTAGNRTIELRNSSNTIITSTVINMAIGANTLNLNFALPVATGLRLGLNSASACNLFRTSSGGPTYPTNIGGMVDLTGTSAATAGYFYFYYNWQLQKNACTSAPVAVTASIGVGPTLTVNSPTICSGQSINLTAGGATTYSWSSGQTTSSIAVTPTASTSYTVYGTTSSCTNSLVSSVSVNPNPTVTVNSATVCSGQNVNLTATGATTYSWSSGQTTSSISITPTASTSYSVTGYNGTCSNVKVSSITVNPNPTVTVNSATVCGGQSVNLTATGATTYSWSSGQTTSSIAVTPTASTSYTVTGTTGSCSNIKVSNITVNPNPTVAITVNSSTICNGQSTTIGASGATTYSWSSGQSTSTITVSPSANTSYSVVGTTGSCADIKVANIVVNPTPVVTVNSSNICVGQTATLTGTGATSYTFNPGAITGNPIAVSPTVSTTYTVIGTNSFNCSSTAVSNVSVSLCTGVQEVPATVESAIKIYPNPADNYIEVFNTISTTKTTINVYDVTGKLITTKEATFYKEYVDMSKFSKGLYFVEIMDGDKRIYKTKIIKQ
jgi:Zn-dependent metalloprotease